MLSRLAFAQYSTILKYLELFSSVPLEQTYMEYDHKSGCFPGDTIRFTVSAYRTDSLIPSTLSKIVYVELRDPQGVAVDRKCLELKDGKTRGYVVLDEFLMSGLYEICAYTRFQTNGREFRNFSRVIPVYAPVDRLNSAERLKLDKVAYIDDKHFRGSNVTLGALKDVKPYAMMFYEGRRLVKGFNSRIMVHVGSNSVKGASATVSVLDKQEGTIVEGTTDWLGNVSFPMSPKLRNKGHGEYSLTISGKGFKNDSRHDFNDAGSHIAISAVQDEKHVNIDIAYEKVYCGNRVCRLLLNNGRVIYSDTCCVAEGGRETIRFSKDSLPKGINSFVILKAYPEDNYKTIATRSFFVGEIENDYESWMYLESQFPYLYIGDNVKGKFTDEVLDNLAFSVQQIQGLRRNISVNSLYFQQLNEEKGRVIQGFITSKTKACPVSNVKLNMEFVQGNVRKKYEVTTDMDGQFFLLNLDLKGDWTLYVSVAEGERRYSIYLRQNFGNGVRLYDLKELDPELYGDKEWKMCKAEKEMFSFIYDCDLFRPKDLSENIPFYYWLVGQNKMFNGISEEVFEQLQYPYFKDESRAMKGGPSYKGKPIIWIVDGKYRMITGLKKLPSDINVLGDATSVPIPLYLDEAKTVIVTGNSDMYKKYVSSPTLDALHPVTVSVRLHENYEWSTGASVCFPYHGIDN